MSIDRKWTPTYLSVDPYADVFALTQTGDYIADTPDFTPSSVRLAHHLEGGELLDKNRYDAMSERSLGLVSKVASLLGRGWVLVVPDHDPAYYCDEDGACMKASSFLWVQLTDLSHERK